MRKNSRRGFTITELVIVTGLFAVLLAVTIGLYVQGNRRSTRLEARLEALQAAHLLRSHLADDVASLIPAQAGRQSIKGATMLALSRVKSGRDCGENKTSLDEFFKPISERVVYRLIKRVAVFIAMTMPLVKPVLRNSSLTTNLLKQASVERR